VLFHDDAVASWGSTIMVSGKHKSPTRSFKVYPDLSLPDIRHILDSQVGVADYLQLGVEGEPSPDHSYTGSGSSAGGCPCRQARPDHYAYVADSDLLEWFPRSPGLYHKESAAESRQSAANHVIEALILGPLFC
jgi:hypothetical protein